MQTYVHGEKHNDDTIYRTMHASQRDGNESIELKAKETAATSNEQ